MMTRNKKSVPRVRATPRLIRDIKPKRQLPRSQIADHNDDWWQEEMDQTPLDDNGGGSLTYPSSRGSNMNCPSERPPGVGCSGGARQRCRTDWKNRYRDSWDRYRRTSCCKKMKQLFWTFILFRTLKFIYFLDLDNYTLSKWQSTETFGSLSSGIGRAQSSVNVQPTGGKGFFTEEDLAEAALYSPNLPLHSLRKGSPPMKPDAPQSVLQRFISNAKSNSKTLVQFLFAPSENNLNMASTKPRPREDIGGIASVQSFGKFS